MPETLSVIIPTYNRRDVLAKALDGYLRQSAAGRIAELVIVDDGSTDDTQFLVERSISRATFPIRSLWQPNKGPAAARNAGVREARAKLILFADSDIVPHRDLVAQHLQWHERHPDPQTAVLGYVTWPDEIRPTPFMQWYGEGRLFVFNRLRNQSEADFQCFYTCNLSLKTAFLRANGQFDESFVTAAYEDTELGYRLSKRGLRLLYNPAAIGYHHQFFSFEDACSKARANAKAAQLFFRKESGREILQTMRLRRSRAGYAIARTVATAATKALFPARPLLNSYLRLPNIIYHLFYWHDATRLLRHAEFQEPNPQDLCTYSFKRDSLREVTYLPPKVRIIVLNWNGWSDTLECLASLERLDYPNYRVIVVDNGSTDDSAVHIRQRFPYVELLETERNLGFSAGCNVGIIRALEQGADYVWLLNNDTTVDSHALTGLVTTAVSDARLGATGSAIYSARRPRQLDAWGGGRINFWLGRSRHATRPVSDEAIDFLTGASILIPRPVLERMGLFDEGFFMYWEDADYCYRLRRAGYRIAVAGESRIWHKGSASVGKASPQMDTYFNASAARFFRRHSRVPQISLWAGVLLRLVKRLFAGKWDHVRAVWTGVTSQTLPSKRAAASEFRLVAPQTQYKSAPPE